MVVNKREKKQRHLTHKQEQKSVMERMFHSRKSTWPKPVTPADIIIAKHREEEKYIRKCMTKWHDGTTGELQWPKEGTFNEECCKEVKEMLRHNSEGKKGKRDFFLI